MIVKQSTLQISLLALFFLLAIGIDQLYAAWSAPTGNPPTCNAGDPGCDVPITTGTAAQTKDGGLAVGTFTSSSSREFTVQGAIATRGWVAIGVLPGVTGTNIPGQLLHLRGRAGVDGIRFPDTSEQYRAAPTLNAVRTYTSSGTWTKPANLAYIIVEAWGGGGGGTNYAGAAGAAGGDTCFGGCTTPLLRANGGGVQTGSGLGGPGGTASGGDINIQGGRGGTVQAFDGSISAAGGAGGSSPRGGSGGTGGYGSVSCCGAIAHGRPGIAPGGGGGGAGDHHSANGPAGGGGGGYGYEMIPLSALPNATYPVTVGAGGTGLTYADGNGGSGANGMVVIHEYTY